MMGPPNHTWTLRHMTAPRSSMYRSGWTTVLTSLVRLNPPKTAELAQDIASRVRRMASSAPAGAPLSKSRHGQGHTHGPLVLVKVLQARRNISAPLACMGKFRRDPGVASVQGQRVQGPTEHGPQPPVQHGVVNRPVRPTPEGSEHAPM